jgi:predicted ester cyclase
MSELKNTAEQFFDACEAGKGWEVCRAFCHPDATFSCQAPALAEVGTIEAYTEWVAGLFTPIPDMNPEIKSFAADEERSNAIVYATIHGTQTGTGGPVPPTGNKVASDYVYVMQFDGDRIRHMTKIWNDAVGLQQLGWA